jgi:hypothetical protein
MEQELAAKRKAFAPK